MLRPLVFCLLATPAFAIPAETTLTLVNDPGYNVLDITVSGPDITTSTAQSFLTGTVHASLDVDHTHAQTSELTLSNGVVTGSDFSATGAVTYMGFTVGSYNLNVTGMAGTFHTTHPPGSVTAATGEFGANQHHFAIDQGTVDGSALGQTIAESFSPESPFEGSGSGTGSVTLTPTGSSGDYVNYDVVVIVPGVTATDSIVVGTTITTTVTVTATGTLKAAGTLQVPKTRFIAWTIAQGIPGAAAHGDVNCDGVPNLVAWALGLGANDPAGPVLPRVIPPSNGFEIPLPLAGTAAPILVETADSPGAWAPLPANRSSTGANPLPAGTSGSVWITPSGLPREFLRLRVAE